LALSTGLSASGVFRIRPAGVYTRPFADDPTRITTGLRISGFLDRWFQERERACLIPFAFSFTNTKANSAYVDHPKQHGRLQKLRLRLGEPKEKERDTFLARRLLGLFIKTDRYKALSFCASSRFFSLGGL